MADDEQLREALLELELLRQREAETLTASRRLVACLEAYSKALDAGHALEALLVEMTRALEADKIVLLRDAPGGEAIVLARTGGKAVDITVRAPVDLFSRKRLVARAGSLGAWQGDVVISPDASMIICPTPPQMALMTLRTSGTGFSKSDQAFLDRLAPLVVQATRNAGLAREKDLLSAAIAGSSSGIAIADTPDPAMPLIYVNRAFERITGYSAAEALGVNCRFLSAEPPDAPERTRLRAAVAAHAPGTFLLRNRRKSGELFWNELSLFPVYDQNGAVRSLVATQNDVTSRIEAAEARDQAKAQMTMALSASEDAFLIIEAQGTIALSNHAVRALFPARGPDWRIGTTFGENWETYLASAQDLPGRITTMLREADLRALSRVPVGQEVDLPDGRTVFVRCAALEDGGLVVTATDISPMKSAQTLLEQRLAAIEAAPDGIGVTDRGGRLTYLNSAAAQLMGFRKATSGLGRIWWHQYKNRIALQNIVPFEPTIAELEDAEGRTHEVTSSPIARGGHVILVRDVTEKLAQESREERMTQQLIEMQRQEALAQLTAGVAHDFNNYLAAINGSAMLLDMASDLPEALRAHVARIASAGTQSARLVNRLLDLGAGKEDARRFDLNSALTDLPDLVDPLLPRSIVFDMARGGGGMLVLGDPAALNDLLLNVILNAKDAIGSAPGRISLETGLLDAGGPADPDAVETPAEVLRVGQLQSQRRYATITITDDGSGMDADIQESIFAPYFSTKGARGTGLGMTMVAAHIKAVGGAIGLASAPGKGTRMRLYWPIVDDGQDTADVAEPGAVDLTGRVVIIVDDDPQVGEVMARYLEAKGAEVALVEDPRDALDAIEEEPDAWHALITDYDMPGMNGGALAERAARAAPRLPIVVVTALARRLNDPRLEQARVRDILPKPVDLARLGALVAQTTGDGN